ncbi:inverse autotransporter beta domain-containing protein [Snodgrassella sp. CFCC 13594]|uniref:inverse autotransporter beta domain-containing protein n=1 Tax=Snodgrassella sp. CFCC 13594 TaxID=1775559 RepID=UPI0008296F35|nr:inverse autotransporter beta domain-containing protein [Snodgrassella sp. CFCC 13594]
MKKYTHFYAFSILFLSIQASSHGIQPQLQIQNQWYNGGNTIGAGLMMPYQTKQGNVPYLDVRYYQNNNQAHAASLGLGYRYSLDDTQFVGINAYLDSIKSQGKKHYRQGSIGAEWFSSRWEANANYYFPVSHRTNILNSADLAEIKDQYLGITTVTEHERLGHAMDIELGTTVWQTPKSSGKFYTGAYWQEKENERNNHGVRLRGEWRINKADWLPKNTALGLGIYGGYDREKHTQLGLQLKLNFGPDNTPSQALYKEVNRQLVFNPQQYQTKKFEQANNYGKVAEFQFAANKTVNVSDLNNAIAELGNKGVALFSGTGVVDNSIIVPDGQTLLGGQGTLQLTTASGKTATYQYAASPAIIHSSSDTNSVVKVGSNTVVDTIVLSGGLSGISNLHTQSHNITLNHLDISKTAGDGIKLDGVDGILVNNTSVHDLSICDNNTACEYAVMSDPNRAPNAAFSSVGSHNIEINHFNAQNVTYGIFVASKINDDGDAYDVVANNIKINDVSITNTRREGLLLVGVDNAQINHYAIDNSERVTNGLRDMDLVVLQGSHNVALSDIQLTGGVNGLMIVNSPSLPAYETNDISVVGMTTSNNNNSGIFINPAANIHLENVTINNPATSGLFLYGSDYEFLGGPVKNLTVKNVLVNSPKQSTLTVWGPVQNLDGEIKVTNSNQLCKSMQWMEGSLDQTNGSVFKVNGETINDFSQCSI